MATAVAWFIVYPASEPMSNAPANMKAVSAQVGSPAYNAWIGNGKYTVQGTSWQVQFGPFATEAQAKAAHAGPLTIGDWVGAAIAGVMIGTSGAPPSAAVPAGAAVGTGIDKIAGFNLGTWFLRIGEILLGLVLVGVGLARVTGAQNFISQIAKTKMPIPV